MRLDQVQVLELLQPVVDQLIGEAAQPSAEHFGMAADLDQGEQPPIVGGKVHFEGKIRVAEILRRQGFLTSGGQGIDQGFGHEL